MARQNYFNTLTMAQKLDQLGRCRFMSASEFNGIEKLKGKKVVIVGCGAQGLNQGLNMRDSGLDVSYALRQGAIDSKRQSFLNASQNGFKVGNYDEMIPTADLVCNLAPDKQHADVVASVMPLMKQGATLAYSHGFNIVEEGQKIRPDLTVVMVALAATLFVLQRGTDIAVQTAANWMSPKERVEKLVQLEAEQNGNFVPAGAASADGPSASDDPNAGKIAVHVIVKTDDGSKITPKLTLYNQTRFSNHTSMGTLDLLDAEDLEYRKTHYFRPCRLLIGASHPDFAAVSSPVVTLMPEDKEKTVELILTRGSTVNAVVTNEQGQPIPQAVVKYPAVFGFGGGSTGGGTEEAQADEAGRFLFSRIANSVYSIEVMAKGYQRLRLRQSLKQAVSTSATEPFKLVLKRARPVSVRVVDKQSNQPIANARLRHYLSQQSHWDFVQRIFTKRV